MMEEKKLTERLTEYGKKYPTKELNLLRELEDMLEDGELISKEWHDEQVGHDKAENERLTEENGYLKQCADTLLEDCKRERKQAVKDTAKEIFGAIFNDCWAIKDENGQKVFVESIIRHIAKKRYGVEVE